MGSSRGGRSTSRDGGSSAVSVASPGDWSTITVSAATGVVSGVGSADEDGEVADGFALETEIDDDEFSRGVALPGTKVLATFFKLPNNNGLIETFQNPVRSTDTT